MVTRDKPIKIKMGTGEGFTTRIDRDLRKELEEFHRRRFLTGKRAKLVAPSLSSTIEFLLARGLDCEQAGRNIPDAQPA